jgi:hypothetical protein
MQDRINLSPLISNIQLELATYLKSNGSALNLTQKELKEHKDGYRDPLLGQGAIPYPPALQDGAPVMYVGCEYLLTGARALNIDLTNEALFQLQSGKTRFSFYDIQYMSGQCSAKEREIKVGAEEKVEIMSLTKAQAELVLNTLSLILKISKQNNLNISVHYQKDHKSTAQNREGGSSALGAWLEKTWFQSRANSALERSERLIESLRRNHPAFAPPKRPFFSSQDALLLARKVQIEKEKDPTPRASI